MSPGKKKRKGHHPEKSKSASLSSTTDEFLGFSSISSESSDDDNFHSTPDEIKNTDGNKKYEEVQEIECDKCLSMFHLSNTDVSERIYEIYNNNQMKQKGFKWFCIKCRTTDITLASFNSNLLSDIGKSISIELTKFKSEIGNEVAKINEKISSLSKSMDELDASTKKPVTWASVVSDSDKNASMVQLLAKKVTDTHKKITLDREDREKNVIIFNVSETNKDEDTKFFNQMCSQNLDFAEVPKVSMARLGAKNSDHQRPLKVSFQESWDKRKFLAKLYKLKLDKKFEGVRVAHDMCEDDRLENKRLLEEAYNRNQKEKPTDFKYKVRGPPWALKIVKVFPKNGSGK